MNKSVALHTLGCKLNFSETSTLARELEEKGFDKKSFDQKADVYIINTCSVTDNADKECRQIVRKVKKQNPEAKVIVTGCYAQLKANEIAALDGVNMVVGAKDKLQIADKIEDLFLNNNEVKIFSCDIDQVEEFTASYSLKDRTRTFLKIQDGCDYTCSYCTIPLARGKSRSDYIENVLENARTIADQGIREIILTGVNIGDFGKGLTGAKKSTESFLDLVKALDEVDGILRVRIGSIEPNLCNDDIIEFVAQSKKIMPHFHMPLQSGSNRLLALMRRRYQKELYLNRVKKIKKLLPHASIGVDVIVGFPTESDSDFEETYNFLSELHVSYLHVFTYSERIDTDAYAMEQVPVHVRRERNLKLRDLSALKEEEFKNQFAGFSRPVLFELSKNKQLMSGFTDNYIKVTAPYREEWVNCTIDYEV